MFRTSSPLLTALCFVVGLSACTDNNVENNNNNGNNAQDATPDIKCFEGEMYNPTTGMCDPVFNMDMSDMPDMTDMPNDDMTDMPKDMPKDDGPDIPPGCDEDGDLYLAESCGGDDCDDNDPFSNPSRAEICDGFDNDCNGVPNNDLECEFFAQTADFLYKVDPFKKTARKLIEVPGLHDMDTDPRTKALYGVTPEVLYRYEGDLNTWIEVGRLGLNNLGDINGLAIDRDGTAFATGENKLIRIDLQTGKGTIIGSMANDVISSGDCVINKGNTLFMTAKKRDEDDTLVIINHTDNSAMAQRLPMKTGFSNVYGLTAAWGKLYGLNSFGELILLDEQTGAGMLIHKFENVRWYGAASSPSR